MNRKVSIIIPVVREDKVKICLRAIEENAGDPKNYEVITAIDTNRIGCPKMLDMLTKKAKHDLVMFLGDDTVPQADFLKEAVKVMDELPDGWGVVGLSTEDPSGWNEQAHFLAHKNMLEPMGGAFYPVVYKHCYGELELRDIATELGRFKYAEKSKVLHDHPINKKGVLGDEHLVRAYSDANLAHDSKTYLRRKKDRMKAKHGIRLAIAEPLTDNMVYSHFHFSSVRVITNYLLHLFQNNLSVHVDFLAPKYPGQIDAIRNGLVQQALEFGCTHILFMDTDQVYHDFDMIQRMLAHDKHIVGTKVHRRYPPFDPLLLRGDPGKVYNVSDEEILEGGLVEVGATGCGCILYDTDVFIELDPPWFELTVGEFGQSIGEDIGFCEKLKEAGHKIYVDCSIDIKHLSLLAVDWGTYKLYKKLEEVK